MELLFDKFSLEISRVGDHFSLHVLVNPGLNFRQEFVLFAEEIFFAQIDEVDDWLGGQEHELVQVLDFLVVLPVSLDNPFFLVNHKILDLVEEFSFFKSFFIRGISLDFLFDLSNSLFQKLDILKQQLFLDDFHISDWVDFSL